MLLYTYKYKRIHSLLCLFCFIPFIATWSICSHVPQTLRQIDSRSNNHYFSSCHFWLSFSSLLFSSPLLRSHNLTVPYPHFRCTLPFQSPSHPMHTLLFIISRVKSPFLALKFIFYSSSLVNPLFFLTPLVFVHVLSFLLSPSITHH